MVYFLFDDTNRSRVLYLEPSCWACDWGLWLMKPFALMSRVLCGLLDLSEFFFGWSTATCFKLNNALNCGHVCGGCGYLLKVAQDLVPRSIGTVFTGRVSVRQSLTLVDISTAFFHFAELRLQSLGLQLTLTMPALSPLRRHWRVFGLKCDFIY